MNSVDGSLRGLENEKWGNLQICMKSIDKLVENLYEYVYMSQTDYSCPEARSQMPQERDYLRELILTSLYQVNRLEL